MTNVCFGGPSRFDQDVRFYGPGGIASGAAAGWRDRGRALRRGSDAHSRAVAMAAYWQAVADAYRRDDSLGW
jgi:hypothetical protein